MPKKINPNQILCGECWKPIGAKQSKCGNCGFKHDLSLPPMEISK